MVMLQRTRSHINADSVKIYSTPRKLVRSLQDQDDENTHFYKNQVRMLRSPCSVKCDSVSKHSSNGVPDGSVNINKITVSFIDKDDHSQIDTKLVTSTENCQVAKKENRAETHSVVEQVNMELSQGRMKCKKLMKISGLKTSVYVFFAVLMALFAVFTSVFLVGNEQEVHYLVPT